MVDDIGMLPVGEDAAEGFYRLVDACYEKRSLAVSSNLHPAGFDEIMPRHLPRAGGGRRASEATSPILDHHLKSSTARVTRRHHRATGSNHDLGRHPGRRPAATPDRVHGTGAPIVCG
jgi:DNA replication protein DnaC